MLLAKIIEEVEDDNPPVPPGEEQYEDDYEEEIEQGKAAWNAAYSIKPGPLPEIQFMGVSDGSRPTRGRG